MEHEIPALGTKLEISLSKSDENARHAPAAGAVNVVQEVPEAPLVVASTQTDLKWKA